LSMNSRTLEKSCLMELLSGVGRYITLGFSDSLISNLCRDELSTGHVCICRIRVVTMLLLNLRMLLAFRMHSRFVALFKIILIALKLILF